MSKPTRPQLAYLRSLADRTGQTFTYPSTFDEASAEIDRLKGVTPQSRSERRYERKLIADQVADRPEQHRDRAATRPPATGLRPPGATTASPSSRSSPPIRRAPARKTGPKVGKRIELARYTVRRGGERILYGQRVDGRVRVTDRPAGARRRAAPRAPGRKRPGVKGRARRAGGRLPGQRRAAAGRARRRDPLRRRARPAGRPMTRRHGPPAARPDSGCSTRRSRRCPRTARAASRLPALTTSEIPASRGTCACPVARAGELVDAVLGRRRIALSRSSLLVCRRSRSRQRQQCLARGRGVGA